MKESLRRNAVQKAKAPAKVTPAPQKAATAAPARHWGAPDPGVLKTVSMAPAAPQAKQSGLDNRMVELAAAEAKRISR